MKEKELKDWNVGSSKKMKNSKEILNKFGSTIFRNHKKRTRDGFSKEYKVVGHQVMECPVCQKTHKVEIREIIARRKVKGKVLEYVEQYCFCENVGAWCNEYVTKAQLKENQKRLDEALKKIQKKKEKK